MYYCMSKKGCDKLAVCHTKDIMANVYYCESHAPSYTRVLMLKKGK